MMATRIERLCDTARQSIAERDWDGAKQAYLQALGLKSDAPDIHYGLATVYFQVRELTSAAHHFREAGRLDPQRAGAFVNLGAVLNLMGQLDEAVAALRKGIQLDPQRVEGYYNIGLVYKRKGQTDLAIQAYREALRLNPRMADAHLNLGNLYFDKGIPRQALNHYEEALRLRPGWDRARDGVARAREVVAGEVKPAPAAPPVTPSARPTDAGRVIDPGAHHGFLTVLHAAALRGEEAGERLRGHLEAGVEPAIKDLSASLLYAGGSGAALEASLRRFEAALEQMRQLHAELQARTDQLYREATEQFPEK